MLPGSGGEIIRMHSCIGARLTLYLLPGLKQDRYIAAHAII